MRPICEADKRRVLRLKGDFPSMSVCRIAHAERLAQSTVKKILQEGLTLGHVSDSDSPRRNNS